MPRSHLNNVDIVAFQKKDPAVSLTIQTLRASGNRKIDKHHRGATQRTYISAILPPMEGAHSAGSRAIYRNLRLFSSVSKYVAGEKTRIFCKQEAKQVFDRISRTFFSNMLKKRYLSRPQKNPILHDGGA